jgi:hypothetical protein
MFNLGEYTLGTLFGVLISLIISHFLSKGRDRETHKAIAFHEAATEFRHSFDDILLNIDAGEHPVHELLRNFFRPHKVAMWHFKYYFVGKARQRFEQAWQAYQAFYDENYEKGSVLAQFSSARTDEEVKKLIELRQHIENLLKYAM